MVQVRARQCGLKAARAGYKAEAQARNVGRAGTRHRVSVNAHQRVAGAYTFVDVFTGDKAMHGIAQMGDAAVINPAHLGQGLGGVSKTLGGNKGWAYRHDSYCAFAP